MSIKSAADPSFSENFLEVISKWQGGTATDNIVHHTELYKMIKVISDAILSNTKPLAAIREIELY